MAEHHWRAVTRRTKGLQFEQERVLEGVCGREMTGKRLRGGRVRRCDERREIDFTRSRLFVLSISNLKDRIGLPAICIQ